MWSAEKREDRLAPKGESDRVLAALSYFFTPLVGLAICVVSRDRGGYLRYHAQQSLACGLAFTLLYATLAAPSQVTAGIAFVFVVVAQYFYTYKAYASSATFTIPVVSAVTKWMFRDFPG